MLEEVKGDNMKKNSEVALCVALNDAIQDETDAPKKYLDLIHEMSNHGMLSQERENKIRNIIQQEMDHELTFIRLAAEVNCPIDKKKR